MEACYSDFQICNEICHSKKIGKDRLLFIEHSEKHIKEVDGDVKEFTVLPRQLRKEFERLI